MEFGNDFELLRCPIHCDSKLEIINASSTSSYFHESILALTHRQSLKKIFLSVAQLPLTYLLSGTLSS